MVWSRRETRSESRKGLDAPAASASSLTTAHAGTNETTSVLGAGAGLTYEQALAAAWSGPTAKPLGPALTDAQLAAPMKDARFIDQCRVPRETKLTIKVAVMDGRARGVSVSTKPANPTATACVDRYVRSLDWPVSTNLDSFTTTY